MRITLAVIYVRMNTFFWNLSFSKPFYFEISKFFEVISDLKCFQKWLQLTSARFKDEVFCEISLYIQTTPIETTAFSNQFGLSTSSFSSSNSAWTISLSALLLLFWEKKFIFSHYVFGEWNGAVEVAGGGVFPAMSHFILLSAIIYMK